MKFRHLNIKNLTSLVPSWAGEVIPAARLLDKYLDKPEFRRLAPVGDKVFSSLDFFVGIDFTQADWPLAVIQSGDDDDDLSFYRGKMVISTKTIYGAPATIVVPLNPVFKGYPSIENTHSFYSHTIGTETPLTYFGITKNAWFKRFSQHVSSARNGSHYLFHRALREHSEAPIIHHVLLTDISYDYALQIEEEFVGDFSLYPLGLNMIPGGSAGIQYLGRLGFQARNASERDRSLRELASRETLNGRPNPLCAARWASDDDFAERVICGHSGRLTAEQVRVIRMQADFGFDTKKIFEKVGARNERQVANVLSGKYYSRIGGGDL